MCCTGKAHSHILSSNRQNHDPLLQHAHTGQMEALHCPTHGGRSLPSVKSTPADTHTYHLTQTNPGSNMQTKTTKKINLHFYHSLLNPPTTTDADQTAKNTAHHCDHSLPHNQYSPLYNDML